MSKPNHPPPQELTELLTNRETLKVIHRSLYDTGWQLAWGYEQHKALARKLDGFFGDDRAHLKSTRANGG